ncbi:hypothetical protein LWC34_45905 [Kibdelosporangium philippinense]|uniref:PPE-repeat protein n=1 Tax=Kibdelosporangium philippinense TaxID=211113 RepID=A0ABS8ZW63_9PSEU|nr:hypothetical protein [Kibdelosporangium philippinense]MCE7010092.1 hypothetical protein [Kibdelosporangium philippinense]
MSEPSGDQSHFVSDGWQGLPIVIAGGPLPPGQIDLMREQAAAYRAYAQRILMAGEGLQHLVDGVADNISPSVAAKFRVHMAELNDGRGQAIADIANMQAWKLDEQATNIDAGRYGIYVQVVWTLTELSYIAANIFLWATWPFVLALGQLMVRLVRMGISYKTAAIIAARVGWEGFKKGFDNVAVQITKNGFDDVLRSVSKGLGEIPTSGYTVPKLIKQIPPDSWWRRSLNVVDEAAEEAAEEPAQDIISMKAAGGNLTAKNLATAAGLGAVGGGAASVSGTGGRIAGLKGSHNKKLVNGIQSGIVAEVAAGSAGLSVGGSPLDIGFGIVNSVATDPVMHEAETKAHTAVHERQQQAGLHGEAGPPPALTNPDSPLSNLGLLSAVGAAGPGSVGVTDPVRSAGNRSNVSGDGNQPPDGGASGTGGGSGSGPVGPHAQPITSPPSTGPLAPGNASTNQPPLSGGGQPVTPAAPGTGPLAPPAPGGGPVAPSVVPQGSVGPSAGNSGGPIGGPVSGPTSLSGAGPGSTGGPAVSSGSQGGPGPSGNSPSVSSGGPAGVNGSAGPASTDAAVSGGPGTSSNAPAVSGFGGSAGGNGGPGGGSAGLSNGPVGVSDASGSGSAAVGGLGSSGTGQTVDSGPGAAGGTPSTSSNGPAVTGGPNSAGDVSTSVNAPAMSGSNGDPANGLAHGPGNVATSVNGLAGLDPNSSPAVSSGPQTPAHDSPSTTINDPSTSPPATPAANPNPANVAQPSSGPATNAVSNGLASAGQNTPAGSGPTATPSAHLPVSQTANGPTMDEGGLPGLETAVVGDNLPTTETEADWDDNASTLLGDDDNAAEDHNGTEPQPIDRDPDVGAETRTLVGDAGSKSLDAQAGPTSPLGVLGGQSLGDRPGNELSFERPDEMVLDVPPVQAYPVKAGYGGTDDNVSATGDGPNPQQRGLTPAQENMRQYRERPGMETPAPEAAQRAAATTESAQDERDPVREELIRTAERVFGKRREEDVDELLRQADELMLRAGFTPPPHFLVGLDPEQAARLDERNQIRLQVAYRLFQLRQDRDSILTPAQELADQFRRESELPRPMFGAGAGPRRRPADPDDHGARLPTAGTSSAGLESKPVATPNTTAMTTSDNVITEPEIVGSPHPGLATATNTALTNIAPKTEPSGTGTTVKPEAVAKAEFAEHAAGIPPVSPVDGRFGSPITLAGTASPDTSEAWTASAPPVDVAGLVAGVAGLSLQAQAAPPQNFAGTWYSYSGGNVNFTLDQVEAHVLNDHNGSVVGLVFPVKDGDLSDLRTWASKRHRLGDHKYKAEIYPENTDDDGPAQLRSQILDTPWSVRQPGRTPFWTLIHSVEKSHVIRINVAPEEYLPDYRSVSVDGQTYGRILSQMHAFREAYGADPDRPFVLMSCWAGHPVASSGRDSVRALAEAGYPAVVYAPTGIGYGQSINANTSNLGASPAFDNFDYSERASREQGEAANPPLSSRWVPGVYRLVSDPVITGSRKADGSPITFQASQAVYGTLRDDRGRVLGVSYPPHPKYRKQFNEYFAVKNRVIDTSYALSLQGGIRDTKNHTQAPWQGRKPFYLIGPGRGDSFRVTIQTNSQFVETVLSGDQYATLTHAIPYFQIMSSIDRTRPVVVLTGQSGFPGSGAARRAAGVLADLGHLGVVYAPTGLVDMDVNSAKTDSWIGVKATRRPNGRVVPGEFVSVSRHAEPHTAAPGPAGVLGTGDDSKYSPTLGGDGTWTAAPSGFSQHTPWNRDPVTQSDEQALLETAKASRHAAQSNVTTTSSGQPTVMPSLAGNAVGSGNVPLVPGAPKSAVTGQVRRSISQADSGAPGRSAGVAVPNPADSQGLLVDEDDLVEFSSDSSFGGTLSVNGHQASGLPAHGRPLTDDGGPPSSWSNSSTSTGVTEQALTADTSQISSAETVQGLFSDGSVTTFTEDQLLHEGLYKQAWAAKPVLEADYSYVPNMTTESVREPGTRAVTPMKPEAVTKAEFESRPGSVSRAETSATSDTAGRTDATPKTESGKVDPSKPDTEPATRIESIKNETSLPPISTSSDIDRSADANVDPRTSDPKPAFSSTSANTNIKAPTELNPIPRAVSNTEWDQGHWETVRGRDDFRTRLEKVSQWLSPGRGPLTADELRLDEHRDKPAAQVALSVLHRWHESDELRARELADRLGRGLSRLRGGAIGIEAESGKSVRGVTEDATLLVRSDWYDVVVDDGRGYPKFEIITKPIWAVRGDDGRLNRDEALNKVREVYKRLTTAPDRTPLSQLFPAHELTDAGRKASAGHLVEDRRLLLHYTVGVPPAGVPAILEELRQNTNRLGTDVTLHRYENLNSGLQFGDWLAARFANVHPAGLQALRGDAEVQALRGFGAVTYNQVAAAAAVQVVVDESNPKSFTAVTSRLRLQAYRAALPPRVRAFLDAHAAEIKAEAGRRLNQHRWARPRSARQNVLAWPGGHGDGPRFTIGDYLDNALRAHPAVHVSQYDVLYVHTEFDHLDTNDGMRRGDGLVLLELRNYSYRNPDAPDLLGAQYPRLEHVVQQADLLSDRIRRLEPTATAASHIEVPFNNKRDVYSGQSDAELRDFVALVAKQAALAAARGTHRTAVYFEGGGNKATFGGRDPEMKGRNRANSVRTTVTNMVNTQLGERGVDPDAVRYVTTSRADGNSASPYPPTGGDAADRRRRVVVWTNDEQLPQPSQGPSSGSYGGPGGPLTSRPPGGGPGGSGGGRGRAAFAPAESSDSSWTATDSSGSYTSNSQSDRDQRTRPGRTAYTRSSNADVAPIAGSTTTDMITGQDADRNVVTFSPAEVHKFPLLNHNGEQVGISYLEPVEQDRAQRWASRAARLTDTMYLSNLTEDTYEHPDDNVVAPWVVSQGVRTPFYVEAHGTRAHFSVQLRRTTPTGPQYTQIYLNSAQYAKLISADQHFVAAAGGGTGRPIVLTSCYTGHPDATSASGLVGLLHERGFGGPFYAPAGVDTGIGWKDSEGSWGQISMTGVKPDRDRAGREVPGVYRLVTNPTIVGRFGGVDISLRAGDVLTVPLVDDENNVIGIAFQPHRGIGVNLSQFATTGYGKLGQEFRDNATEETLQTPWSTLDTPFYVASHGDTDGFLVSANRGGARAMVSLDGTQFGKLVTANPWFQIASSDNPNRPVVYLTSGAGRNPESSIARAAAVEAAAAGHRGDSFAPNGRLFSPTSGSGNDSWHSVARPALGEQATFEQVHTGVPWDGEFSLPPEQQKVVDAAVQEDREGDAVYVTRSSQHAAMPSLTDPSGPVVITGHDPATGQAVRFAPGDAYKIVLQAGTEPVGIGFPQRGEDDSRLATWASRPLRLSDTAYVPDYDAETNGFRTGRVPTPWALQTGVGKPFYVWANGNGNVFTVELPAPDGSDQSRLVDLSNAEYAKLLMADQHFVAATGGARPRPIVFMSGHIAHPDANAATELTRLLENGGIRGPFYAPSGADTGRLFDSEETPWSDISFSSVDRPPLLEGDEQQAPGVYRRVVDPEIVGHGPDGEIRRFREADVKSAVLTNRAGEVIGVQYPGADPANATELSLFTTTAHQNTGIEVLENYARRGRFPQFDARLPLWSNKKPFYVAGYGDAGGFRVTLDPADGQPGPVTLSGTEFGKLVAASPWFQIASGANPVRPVVYLTSGTGHGPSPVAGAAAASVASYGHRGASFAPNGELFTEIDQRGSRSWHGVGRPAPGEQGTFVSVRSEGATANPALSPEQQALLDAADAQETSPAVVQVRPSQAGTEAEPEVPSVEITGFDPETGDAVTFSSADVLTTGLRNHRGEPVGVGFPKQDGQEETKFVSWAARPLPLTNYKYSPDYGQSSRLVATPWATRGITSTPLYESVHGNPENLGVSVRQADGTYATAGLYPGEYAKVLLANTHFHRAMSVDPSRPIVFVSCNLGAPTGEAAAELVKHLERGWVRGPVFVPTGMAQMIHYNESQGPWQNISAAGVQPGNDGRGRRVPGVFRLAVNPRITGSREGQPFRFRHENVLVQPLTDDLNNVIGLAFPTDDSGRVTDLDRFTRVLRRGTDRHIIKNSAGQGRVDPSRAPWSGKSPFYVASDGGANGFQVSIRTSARGFDVVTLDGTEFGRLVAASPWFQTASSVEPDRPVVYLTSSAGLGGASSISGAAASELSAMGHYGNSYAPNGVLTTQIDEERSQSWHAVSRPAPGRTGTFETVHTGTPWTRDPVMSPDEQAIFDAARSSRRAPKADVTTMSTSVHTALTQAAADHRAQRGVHDVGLHLRIEVPLPDGRTVRWTDLVRDATAAQNRRGPMSQRAYVGQARRVVSNGTRIPRPAPGSTRVTVDPMTRLHEDIVTVIAGQLALDTGRENNAKQLLGTLRSTFGLAEPESALGGWLMRDSDHAGSGAGAAVAEPATRIAGSATGFQGTFEDGTPVSFTADQLLTVPLHGADNQLIGLTFPADPETGRRAQDWASRPIRESDRAYVPDYRDDKWLEPEARVATPWSARQPGRVPFYLNMHATRGGFVGAINVAPRGATPQWRSVEMAGAEHGRVIAANTNFAALSADPGRPLVYMSCLSGHPDGEAAMQSVRVLRESGYTGAVYAPTGKSIRLMSEPNDSSELPDYQGERPAKYSFYGVEATTDRAGQPVSGVYRMVVNPSLTGTVAGSEVTFDATQVLSGPLRDNRQNVIGIGFPRDAVELADMRSAAVKAQDTSATPFYVASTGGNRTFDVTVMLPSNQQARVEMTGAEFGKLVSASGYFQMASGSDINRPLVMLRSNEPVHDAVATDVVDSVRSYGHLGTLYTPNSHAVADPTRPADSSPDTTVPGPVRDTDSGGFELETGIAVSLADKHDQFATVVTGPHFDIKLDWFSHDIVEIVSHPAKDFPEEEAFPEPGVVHAEVRKAYELLLGAEPRKLLTELFPVGDGYEHPPTAGEVRIAAPAPGLDRDRLALHFTSSAPVIRLRDVFRLAGDNAAMAPRKVKESNDFAMAFGDRVAARMLGIDSRAGNFTLDRSLATELDRRGTDEVVNGVRSMATLVASHGYMVMRSLLRPHKNRTNYSLLASRTSLAALYETLPPPAREYLARNADQILMDIEDHFRAVHREDHMREMADRYGKSVRERGGILALNLNPDRQGHPDHTLALYLRNGLQPVSQDQVIGQDEAIRMHSVYLDAYDHFGRLPIPQALVEFRMFGQRHRTLDDIRATSDKIGAFARDIYLETLRARDIATGDTAPEPEPSAGDSDSDSAAYAVRVGQTPGLRTRGWLLTDEDGPASRHGSPR